MPRHPSAPDDAPPEQIDQGRRWIRAWKTAAPVLERLRRQELRAVDAYRAIALLCGDADYTVPPRAPKATSGLIDQQRLLRKLSRV